MNESFHMLERTAGEGFLERLRTDVLVTWAPFHSMLVDWGKDLESHLSEWIIRHPREFQDALKQSYAAGCDLGTTATQAASLFRSEPFGQAVVDRVYELNYYSAKLAKEVPPPNHYLCGDISSSNPDFLEPVGNMTVDELYEGYKNQAVPLIEGGIDLFFIGGNQVEAAEVAIKVVKDLTDLPIIAANVFYKGKRGFRTMTGVDPETASVRLKEAGADVVGWVCGLMTSSPDNSQWYQEATNLTKEVRKGCKGFLYAQPDAGMPQLISGKTVWPALPEEMAGALPDWTKAGARVVGGCCGTDLGHIARISSVLRQMRAKGLIPAYV